MFINDTKIYTGGEYIYNIFDDGRDVGRILLKYIHTYTHIYIYTYIHTYTHIYIHTNNLYFSIGFYMSSDRINDLCCAMITRDDAYDTVIGSQNKKLQVLQDANPILETTLEGAVNEIHVCEIISMVL